MFHFFVQRERYGLAERLPTHSPNEQPSERSQLAQISRERARSARKTGLFGAAR